MDRQKVARPLRVARLLRVVRPLRNEGGFVLLITLVVVLLLTVIIFEIDFQSRADLRAAGNFRDDLSAYYVALSGITFGKEALREDLKNSGTTDHLNEVWAVTLPPIPVGEGEFSGKITDEAGKFNLNGLVDNPTPPATQTINLFKQRQLRRLFELLSVDPNLVDAIIDWIDTNTYTEPNGAEDETYQTLPFPYPTKNGRLTTLEEILYIKGITPEIYQKIAPYLTVVSTDGKINVNTADTLILQSIDPSITEPIADSLVKGGTYPTAQRFFDALPSSADKVNMNFSILFAVRSDIFSLASHGTVRNTRKTIHAIWNRTPPGSYLYYKVE